MQRLLRRSHPPIIYAVGRNIRTKRSGLIGYCDPIHPPCRMVPIEPAVSALWLAIGFRLLRKPEVRREPQNPKVRDQGHSALRLRKGMRKQPDRLAGGRRLNQYNPLSAASENSAAVRPREQDRPSCGGKSPA